MTVRRDELDEALKTVRLWLERCKADRRDTVRAILMTEESLVRLFEHAEPGVPALLRVKKSFGSVNIEISLRGTEFEFVDNSLMESSLGTSMDAMDDAEESIRARLLATLSEYISYRYSNGKNTVRITALRSRYELLFQTLAGLFLGLLAGLLLKLLLPAAVCEGLNTNVFTSVSTLFLNALQTMVGPVVFFSIASSISGFGSISDMGKIGGKVMLSYLLMSLFAIGVGIGLFYLFRPGDPALAASVAADSFTADTAAVESVTILGTLLGIIPSNIVRPFLEANMLQIISLAVMCGIGVSLMGAKAENISALFNSFNDLFIRITTMLIRFIPFVTFCSMCSMMLSVGGEAFLSVLNICLVVLLGLFALVALYAVIIVLFTGSNPITFFRKYFPTMLQVFSLSSSSASIPINMQACRSLGVAPKLFSFSIPLGATINMNGVCIHLSICALAFAHVYGVEITGSMLATMAVAIIALSIGAPGIPGVGLVLMAVLLDQFGVPVAVISLIMGVNPILDMFVTTVNCLGDVVTTFIVAKSEDMLDRQAFTC